MVGAHLVDLTSAPLAVHCLCWCHWIVEVNLSLVNKLIFCFADTWGVSLDSGVFVHVLVKDC